MHITEHRLTGLREPGIVVINTGHVPDRLVTEGRMH